MIVILLYPVQRQQSDIICICAVIDSKCNRTNFTWQWNDVIIIVAKIATAARVTAQATACAMASTTTSSSTTFTATKLNISYICILNISSSNSYMND